MSINDELVELANQLDKGQHIKCADLVDDLIKFASVQKVAQYVGAIGYVLKQNRAMANCIRQKRVASDSSMQDVILSCLQEYQDGQDYHDTQWTSKYADVIRQAPESFNQLHLHFLSELGNANNIDEHIRKVASANEELHKINHKNEIIASVMNHIEAFGTILGKEVGSDRPSPFKLAAPPSPRGFWSRLFNPSQVSANPLSWSRSRRERGESSDTRREMDDILAKIMSVTNKVQQVKLSARHLSEQINWENLGLYAPADQHTLTLLSQVFSDPNSWLELRDALGTLDNIMTTNAPGASKGIRAIHNQMNEIFGDLSDVQQIMMSLRQREDVIGRDVMHDEFGRHNPYALSSPHLEYESLDRTLNRLYNNPFDEEALRQAQRMHSRLDDRLRGLRYQMDDLAGMFQELQRRGWSSPQVMQEISRQTGMSQSQINNALEQSMSQESGQSQTTPQIPSHREPTRPEPVTAPASGSPGLTPESRENINASVTDILDSGLVAGGSEAEKASNLWAVLSRLAIAGPLADPSTQAETSYIEELLQRARSPQSTGGSTPLVDEGPMPGEVIPREELEQHLATGEIEEDEIDWLGDGAYGQISDEADRYLREEDDKGMVKASLINGLVKLADHLDKINPSLGDLIDQYIEDNLKEDLPPFPEFSHLIREN